MSEGSVAPSLRDKAKLSLNKLLPERVASMQASHDEMSREKADLEAGAILAFGHSGPPDRACLRVGAPPS